jgi:small subunit ribosomal protein S20
MANTKSATKHARKAAKKHLRRVAVKSELKTLRKKALVAGAEKTPEVDGALLAKQAVQKYARAASNGYIHTRTASRKIGRLMKAMHKLSKETK